MTNLSEQQHLGRAKNAVSAYLTRKLSVPKIYLDASWNREPVDLLAIDRAGVGDVHAVRMVSRELDRENGEGGESIQTIQKVCEHIKPMHSLPCQYRYVAIVSNLSYGLQLTFSPEVKNQTFADDGVGRIGILFVDVFGDELRIDEIVKPERFRSTKQILALSDEYVANHTANMEYRDPADYEAHI